jgi:hypothetical protein
MLDSTLIITIQHIHSVTYYLRGIIYHDGNHFAAHIINTTGQIWYHDSMKTGPQKAMIVKQAGTCSYTNAIVAVYSYN